MNKKEELNEKIAKSLKKELTLQSAKEDYEKSIKKNMKRNCCNCEFINLAEYNLYKDVFCKVKETRISYFKSLHAKKCKCYTKRGEK